MRCQKRDPPWYIRAFFIGYDPEPGEGETGFKGVTNGARGKFKAFRKVNGKNVFYGEFIHKEDAAMVATYARTHKVDTKEELVILVTQQ